MIKMTEYNMVEDLKKVDFEWLKYLRKAVNNEYNSRFKELKT